MICDVCGRANADKLTFCQDCGRRLRQQGARGVPPTPPAGMAKVELPASASSAPPAPLDAARARAAQAASRSRPEAPVFAFGPLGQQAPVPPPTPPPPAPPMPSRTNSAAPPPRPRVTPAPAPVLSPPSVPPAVESPRAGSRCGTCNTENPPAYRYCVSCGAPLPAAATTPEIQRSLDDSARDLRPPPVPLIAPVPTFPDEKIVPTPVLDIASTRRPPPKLVTCSRCHGQCAPGTRFCKYCGAPLEEAASRPDAPPSSPLQPTPLQPMAVAPFETGPASGRMASQPPPPVSGASGRPPSLRPPVPDAPRPLPPPVRAGSTAPGRVDPTRSPGLPAVPRELGRIVLIAEDGSEGRAYPLMSPQVDIGRSEGEIVLRDDSYVSPRHARLIDTRDGLVLRDLASTNGVFLRIRKREPLRDGDLLLLGLEVLQFQVVSNAERGLGHATQHGTLLFGSPAVPRHARLCQRTIEGVTRDVYHLFRDETVIGREQGDIVFSADPFLSRRHAAITREPSSGEFWVRDLDSSNGSYRAVREDVVVQNGDFVRIGQHLFRVDLR